MKPLLACLPRTLSSVFLALVFASPFAARAEAAPPPAATPPTAAAPVTGVAPAPAAAAKPAPPPQNEMLDNAKAHIAKKKYDDALKELAKAEEFPGNTPAMKTDIALAKMQALLLKRKPDQASARAIALDLLHADPEGAAFQGAPAQITQLVSEIRDSQPIIVHEPIAIARPDRALKFIAKVQDLTGLVARMTLHVRLHGTSSYSDEPCKKDQNGFEALLRSPDALAPSGSENDFVVDYYLSAEDAKGKVLDTNTPRDRPIELHLTNSFMPKQTIDYTELSKPPPPPPIDQAKVAADSRRRTYIIAGSIGAAAVVAGVVTAIAVVANRPHPLPANVGVLQVP